MIDHVYISVTNIENSLAFYSETLKPLGWHECGSYSSASGPEGVPDLFGLCDDIYGTGNGVGSSIWLRQRQVGETGVYPGGGGGRNRAAEAETAAATREGGFDEGEPAKG